MANGGAMLVMPPRKKSSGRPKASEPVHAIASLKGTDALERWIDGLVDHSDLKTRTLVIWHALKVFAEQSGYTEPIPKR